MYCNQFFLVCVLCCICFISCVIYQLGCGVCSVGVHMQDLESALHYALRQEIAICKTIQGPKLDALHTFVSILAKV